MATTTNYGWTTPDDTALLKDGASAIRSLGSSIDTTTKNLNPETTLGDISYRSSTANTNTRLAIGTSGQVLTVSSGVPAWTTLASGGKTLLSTTSLSGSTTTVSSISGSYKDLEIVLTDVTSNTAGYELSIQVNSDSANHSYFMVRNNDNDTQANVYAHDGGYFKFGGTTTSTNADDKFQGFCVIYNYALSSAKTLFGFGSMRLADASNRGYTSRGRWSGTAAITSVTFYADGAQFNGGTARIYGVN
jgi:hypothetical protein